jgi:hypothetical protein
MGANLLSCCHPHREEKKEDTDDNTLVTHESSKSLEQNQNTYSKFLNTNCTTESQSVCKSIKTDTYKKKKTSTLFTRKMFINEEDESQDTQVSLPQNKIESSTRKKYQLEDQIELIELKSRINKRVNKHFRIKQKM